jgi:pimeloyl-ACP methyl ester carboxylesterase
LEQPQDDVVIGQLSVPALLIHVRDDRLAAYGHAVRASRRIPGTRLVTIPIGGQLFLGQQRRIRVEASHFVHFPRVASSGPTGR